MNALKLVVLLSLLLLPTASALELEILEDIQCDADLPVSLNFATFCTGDGDSTCTFGQDEVFQGALIYDGLVDFWNATKEDVFIMRSDLRFSIAGYKTFEHKMLDETFGVCFQFTDSEGTDGENVECPQDGTYSFSGNYTMPAADDFLDWAASGYRGQVVISMFLNSMNLMAGQCTMKVRTISTHSDSDKSKLMKMMPDGRLATILTIATFFGLCLCICYSCWCKRPRKSRISKEALLLPEEKEKDIENERFENEDATTFSADLSEKDDAPAEKLQKIPREAKENTENRRMQLPSFGDRLHGLRIKSQGRRAEF